MARGHHPRRAVEDGAEVVVAAQLRFAGRDPHAYGQFERSLCRDCSLNSRTGRGEYGAHPIAGVVEHLAVMGFDYVMQCVIVCLECGPHSVRIGLPPPGRAFDIREQERDNTHGDASECRSSARARSIWSNA
jgi:hypothetical protein